MSDTPDWIVIDRYLAGAAAPDERRQVEAWVAADPARSALLQSLGAAPVAEPVFNVDRAWQRFDAGRRAEPVGARVRPMKRRAFPAVWRMAAAAALVIGAAATWEVTRQSSPAAAPAHELIALNGQRSSVTLSDGTRVTLNGGSRLRYGASYADGARDVYLDGAAYFDVAHDAARPFRVHAHGAVIQDIGTKFSVRAYADQANLEVAVAEGIVALGHDSATVASATRLSAGDVALLGAAGPPVVTRAASLDSYMAGRTAPWCSMAFRSAAQPRSSSGGMTSTSSLPTRRSRRAPSSPGSAARHRSRPLKPSRSPWGRATSARARRTL
jgi:transmembrane sensor